MSRYGGQIHVTEELRGWTVTMIGPNHKVQKIKRDRTQAIEEARDLKELQEHNERRIGYKNSVYRLFIEGDEVLDAEAIDALAEATAPQPEPELAPVEPETPAVAEEPEPDPTPTIIYDGHSYEDGKLKLKLTNPTDADILVWRSVDGKDGTRKLRAGVSDKWSYKCSEESLVIFAEESSEGPLIFMQSLQPSDFAIAPNRGNEQD